MLDRAVGEEPSMRSDTFIAEDVPVNGSGVTDILGG
jgi:hypothetical protein